MKKCRKVQIYANHLILFHNEDGEANWVRPSKQVEVVAKNELPGRTLATPAFSNGAMYLRTDEHLYKFAKGVTAVGHVGARDQHVLHRKSRDCVGTPGRFLLRSSSFDTIKWISWSLRSTRPWACGRKVKKLAWILLDTPTFGNEYRRVPVIFGRYCGHSGVYDESANVGLSIRLPPT